jgi:hypothetical protein
MTPHLGEQLSAFRDGALSATEAEAVAAHLKVCEDCSQALQEYGLLESLVRTGLARAPEGYFHGFPARVRGRIESDRVRPQRQLPAWAWAAAAALAAAAVIPLTLRTQLQTAAAPEGVAAPTRRPQAQAAPSPDGMRAAEPRSELQRRPILAERDEARAPASSTPPSPRVPRTAAPGAVGGVAAPPAPAPRSPNAMPQGGGFAGAPAVPAAAAPTEAASLRANQAGRADLSDAVERADVSSEEKIRAEQEGLRSRSPQSAEKKEKGDRPARSDAAPDFAALRGRTAETAEEARRLREAWRRLIAVETDPVRADEARVRVVELGALAYRLARDREDGALARADAEAYLSREDAPQKDRVRELLGALSR